MAHTAWMITAEQGSAARIGAPFLLPVPCECSVHRGKAVSIGDACTSRLVFQDLL